MTSNRSELCLREITGVSFSVLNVKVRSNIVFRFDYVVPSSGEISIDIPQTILNTK